MGVVGKVVEVDGLGELEGLPCGGVGGDDLATDGLTIDGEMEAATTAGGGDVGGQGIDAGGWDVDGVFKPFGLGGVADPEGEVCGFDINVGGTITGVAGVTGGGIEVGDVVGADV